MSLMHKTSIILIFIFGFHHIASANDYCPKKVGAMSEAIAHEEITSIYTNIFNELECEITIVKVPGQRIIKLLNTGKLDGDLLRFPVVEEKYQFDFIRSNPPVLKDLVKGVFKFPGSKVNNQIPKGVVLGSVWQEKYADAHRDEDMAKVILYYSYDEILKAYQNQEINAFLSEQPLVDHAFNIGQIDIKPELHKAIHTDNIHLYLRAEYADFMRDFGKIITKKNPFADNSL
ncbi:hypothetical protein [Curvivirga sp.]|uniref:hypothetical protein n=1 Tax=Curvivirga sp. TaxID=2856848 RepID=UPI003B5A40B2